MSDLKVIIPEPCTEDWEQMTPTQKGKHCAKCDKEVQDFSGLNQQELDQTLQEIHRQQRDVCGLFGNEQLAPESPKTEGLILDMAAYSYNTLQLFAIALVFAFILGGFSSCKVVERTAGPPIIMSAGYSVADHLSRFENQCNGDRTGGEIVIVRDTISVTDSVEIAKKRSLFFETATYALDENDVLFLDSLIEDLKQLPAYELEIIGHTDNVGSAKYNKELSAKRAKTVSAYLQDQGITVSKSRGVGFQFPKASNVSVVGRKSNRRVEIIIYEK